MAKRREKAGENFICPNCGAEVPVGAKSCRECGASDDSGWGEDDFSQDEGWIAGYGPDQDFDYDEFVRREFPGQSPVDSKYRRKRWAMAVLVAIVAAAFLVSVLFWG
jgi:hypothetical protein